MPFYFDISAVLQGKQLLGPACPGPHSSQLCGHGQVPLTLHTSVSSCVMGDAKNNTFSSSCENSSEINHFVQ